MIRAFVAVNADGHVLKKSLISLPSSVMEMDELHALLENSLIMATMDVVPKTLPTELALISRKSLLAEHPTALATMLANIETKDVGDIAVLANGKILDEMDAINIDYDLVVMHPTHSEMPDSLVEGRTHVDSTLCDSYTIDTYRQTVSDASDTQIADAIDGIESYFNVLDSMDHRDKDAVEKIVKGVKMLNRAISRDNADGNYDSFGDGAEVGAAEVDDEIERIWDTLQLVSDQMSETTDLVLDTQDTLADILSFVKTNLPTKQMAMRANMMAQDIDGLRNQLGAHIAESGKKPTNYLPYIVACSAVSLISLVLTVINLCC